MTNDEVVSAFLAEWSAAKPEPARLASYFSDDAVYHNMPVAPIAGRDAIAKAFGGILMGLESRGWEVLRQVAAGDLVINERIDRFARGDKLIELPVAGVFEVRDGKISAWRDYFDMGAWQRQMT